MKKLLLLVVLFPVVAHAQKPTEEKPPTVEKCQLDRALGSKETSEKSGDLDLPYEQILNRMDELLACSKVDTTHNEEYLWLRYLYSLHAKTRLLYFILRHNLLLEFLREDYEGKRGYK